MTSSIIWNADGPVVGMLVLHHGRLVIWNHGENNIRLSFILNPTNQEKTIMQTAIHYRSAMKRLGSMLVVVFALMAMKQSAAFAQLTVVCPTMTYHVSSQVDTLQAGYPLALLPHYGSQTPPSPTYIGSPGSGTWPTTQSGTVLGSVDILYGCGSYSVPVNYDGKTIDATVCCPLSQPPFCYHIVLRYDENGCPELFITVMKA
jgi:hypothetical protein